MSAVPFVAPLRWSLRHSPNQSPRQVPVDAIVLHADASGSVAATIDWCGRESSKVSYHVVIGRGGQIYQLVPPGRQAWHAGESEFQGRRWCNAYSVGVCLSNKNDGIDPYPPAQLAAAEDVCATLCRHYGIAVERITTHAEVARPRGRKTDPKGFDLFGFKQGVARRLLTMMPAAPTTSKEDV